MPNLESDADTTVSPPFNLDLTLQSDDFHTEWQRCSLVANYLAEYLAYQFPERGRAENLISMVTNELLEALTHLTPENSTVVIQCSQHPDQVEISAQFQMRPGFAEAFNQFLGAATHNEAHYLDLLAGEITPGENFNQLGLAMLTHDFNVEIQNRLEPESQSVHTQLLIPIQELQI